MTLIDRTETVEVEIRTLYGEGEVHVKLPNGDLRTEWIHGDRGEGQASVSVRLPVPDPDHAVGLAFEGRANALDALRSGQA